VIESDSEDEADSFVRKSMHPACPAESTLYKKRRRYITWNSKPATMVSDLLKCKAVAAKSREEFSSLERDEERWAECFEIARHKLNSSLANCQEKNNRLRLEAKHLYELVVLECGPALSVRKRRASQMRDILEELDDRQMQLEGNIEEYEKIALASVTNGSRTDGDGVSMSNGATNGSTSTRVIPVVHMTIDELDYPEDVVSCGISPTENDDTKKKVSSSDPKTSGVQSRREMRTRNLKKSKLAAGGEGEDKNEHHNHDDEEDSDGTGGDFGRAGSVAEFCSMFAAVDGSVRLGEASLTDLDPFFSDDEGEDGTQIAVKGTVKGSSSQAKGANATAKALTASQKAATLKAASTWDSFAEYQRECKLAEPFALPTEKKEGASEVHWAQCVADASQCPDLVRTGLTSGQASLVPRTRLARGAGSGAVNLSAFAISRTPRGVPLIISPLSQFEDRYLGAVCGSLTGSGTVAVSPLEVVSSSGTGSTVPAAEASPGTTGKSVSDKKATVSFSSAGAFKDEGARLERQDAVAVHVTVQLPASLIAAEDAALERCRLQSLAAAAENKIKRLRASNIEWCRQSVETGQSLVRSKALFSQAHRDDIMEAKIIRRELITYGIVTAKDTDPPLSPVGEYLPQVAVHGVGKGKGGGGPVNRKGVRSIRGLNFAVANAAMLSNSPNPLLGGAFTVNPLLPLDTTATTAAMASFAESAGLEEEGGSIVDDISVVDAEENEGDAEGDSNRPPSLLDPSFALKGKDKGKAKAGKGKNNGRGKEEETEVKSESHPSEDDEAGVIDSQGSTGDSPSNNGAKKRGGAVSKPNPAAAGTVSDVSIPAAKRRGNGSGGQARRR
jgi:hypothetical protein